MFDLNHRGRVAVLTLDRPPVNAMDPAWAERFNAILDALAARDDWSVLHIRSARKVFCAGADLNHMRRRIERPEGVEAMAGDVRGFQILFERLESLPQVTLAEIGGAAMGGGLELALSCDLRVAAADAPLGLPEGRLGLLPGAGGTQRLTRLCGPGTAARVILACDVVDGAEARDLGLVQWAVPAARLAEEARALAERVAALPAASLAAAKRCMALARDPNADGFAAEIAATRDLMASPETRARVAAFLEKRAPRNVADTTGAGGGAANEAKEEGR